MDEKQILALPIRALRKSTKRIVFELAGGDRFCIVGGKDQREPPDNLPSFSPDEMILALGLGISEREFISILNVKGVFRGSVMGNVTKSPSRETATKTRQTGL